MQLKYALNENDFLTYQLYQASKKESVRAKRNRSRIITPIIYIAFSAFIFSIAGLTIVVVILILVAIFWYIFYPM